MIRGNKWLQFAQEDLKVAGLCFDEGIFNQVCFHSQQGVEKILKGFIPMSLRGTQCRSNLGEERK